MITDRTVSIVIPVYNSEKTLNRLMEQLDQVLAGKIVFEVILVNDYSRDNSLAVIRQLAQKYSNVKAISLSKNFGQHNAIMAGLRYAGGDYVITMDDDLQHPAEEIFKLIGEAEKGYDVIYGEYISKNHSSLKNLGSEINNQMANLIIKKPKWLRFTSFRIIRSFVVRELIKYDAPYPYIDGLLLRVTTNIGVVKIEHHERKEGRSNYTFKKLLRLWMNGFLNFSIVPLRLFAYLGIAFAGIGFMAALVILIQALFFYMPIQGWTSLIISTLMFSGVQLLSIGMVGEYVGRIFLTQNKTPQYVVRESIEKVPEGTFASTTNPVPSHIENNDAQTYEYSSNSLSVSNRLS